MRIYHSSAHRKIISVFSPYTHMQVVVPCDSWRILVRTPDRQVREKGILTRDTLTSLGNALRLVLTFTAACCCTVMCQLTSMLSLTCRDMSHLLHPYLLVWLHPYLLVWLHFASHHSEGVGCRVVVDLHPAKGLPSRPSRDPALVGVVIQHDCGPSLADTRLT